MSVRENSVGVSALFPMIGPPRPGLEGPRGEVSGDRQDPAFGPQASAAARRAQSSGLFARSATQSAPIPLPEPSRPAIEDAC